MLSVVSVIDLFFNDNHISLKKLNINNDVLLVFLIRIRFLKSCILLFLRKFVLYK